MQIKCREVETKTNMPEKERIKNNLYVACLPIDFRQISVKHLLSEMYIYIEEPA